MVSSEKCPMKHSVWEDSFQPYADEFVFRAEYGSDPGAAHAEFVRRLVSGPMPKPPNPGVV